MEWYEIARSQRGLVARQQLLSIGITDEEIDRLVRQRHWQQLQRGVYLTGSKPADWEQKVLAAILAAGGDAHASHRTAARIRGLDGAEKHTIIEITVSVLRGPAPKGVFIHRSRRSDPADRTIVDGIPVSTVDRTLLDYAAKVPPILVERAVEDAIRRGRTTEGQLRRRLARSGKGVRGVTRLRKVLDGRPDGRAARSGFEVIVLDIIREYGLPLPTRRPLVTLSHDRKVEIDLLYAHERVAVEPMGRKWHSTATQLKEGAEKRTALERAGYQVVPVYWDEAIWHPGDVARRVEAAIARSCPSPRRTTTRKSAES